MPETAEEMSEKYTRADLEDMARKHGISPVRKKYPSKTSLAEAIIKSKGVSEYKPPMAVSERKPPMPHATMPSHRAGARVELHAGKTGVMAKKAAIEAQEIENKKGVARIDGEIANFQAAIDTTVKGIFGDVRIFREQIGAEAGAIRNAVAKMDSSVRDYRQDMAKEKTSIDEYVKNEHGDVRKFKAAIDTKVKSIFGGVRVLEDSIEAQAVEDRDAVAKMDSSVRNYRQDMAKEKSKIDTSARALRQDIAKEKTSIDEYVKNEHKDVINFQAAMDVTTKEIQNGARQIDNDIMKFRDDIASYRQEFYFG
jgi:hypothetical protein